MSLDRWTRASIAGLTFCESTSGWIEMYNGRRRHSALGYLSPVECERNWHAAQASAVRAAGSLGARPWRLVLLSAKAPRRRSAGLAPYGSRPAPRLPSAGAASLPLVGHFALDVRGCTPPRGWLGPHRPPGSRWSPCTSVSAPHPLTSPTSSAIMRLLPSALPHS